MAEAQLAALDKERRARRIKLNATLKNAEDPLAVYDEFIKWTLQSYPPELIPRSGLIESLEETVREFRSDKTYKGDRRYLKIWLTYAQYVDDTEEDPAVEVYKYLLKQGVGTAYAQLYEDYALCLERFGRCVALHYVAYTTLHAQ